MVALGGMQAPCAETPPPPLAGLWERVVRARAPPAGGDVALLYRAIRERLARPEAEVRLHALRVLAELLPLSGNALAFPFDQAVDNLGHCSPNVRKAALDALKVFCAHCEEPECAARALLDKCYYHNIRPRSADLDAKLNVITGLILSIPSVMAILKRRSPALDTFPVYQILGEKLFDPVHRDVAYRALLKLRKINGSRDYMSSISRLDPKIQEKFRFLCETYDEDSLDVYYAPRKTMYGDERHRASAVFSPLASRPTPAAAPAAYGSADSSSEDSYGPAAPPLNNFAKVIIETEIKFDSDTAITMTVLEESEESRSECSEPRALSSDDEDPDVVVKRVRFGGEVVKIRTPDSDARASEDDSRAPPSPPAPPAPAPLDARRELPQKQVQVKVPKKSGIPLPVIKNKTKVDILPSYNGVKLKSKSLSELYDYFRCKNDTDTKSSESSFGVSMPEARPAEAARGRGGGAHREVEVLHNLQREPVLSPRSRHTIHLDEDGFVLNLLGSSPPPELLSPMAPPTLKAHYDWEALGIVPQHVVEQLHNTENWIGAVRAADQLHGALLEAGAVRRAEPAAGSLVEHMFALSEAVAAARAPAEGAVCALLRGASAACARALVPALAARLAREPPPAALPHALLHRLALHHLVDLIFEPTVMRMASEVGACSAEEGAVRAALCVARAAGPAALLAAVRRRLAPTQRADAFCRKLRDRLTRPLENIKPSSFARRSQLPVRGRRARSTPPPAAPTPPRRLRPLPDSAPLFGTVVKEDIRQSAVTTVPIKGPKRTQPPRDDMVKPLSPIPLSDRDTTLLTDADHLKQSPADETDGFTGDDDDNDKPQDPERTRETSPVSRRSLSLHVEDYPEAASGAASPAGDEPEQSSPARSPPRSPARSPAAAAPAPAPDPGEATRDVRAELALGVGGARPDDWQEAVAGLARLERLAAERGARAPAAAWRTAARGACPLVRSLRSRVARAACRALGALFEHRGRALEPELEEAAGALLDRCADVNRFLRADAGAALTRVACGGAAARGVAALCRRGAGHRAGAVRAAAAGALARLAEREGGARVLSLPGEARALLLRAAGELLADASAEARAHARALCAVLAEDARFRPLLKEAMTPSRFRTVEKLLDRLPPPPR